MSPAAHFIVRLVIVIWLTAYIVGWLVWPHEPTREAIAIMEISLLACVAAWVELIPKIYRAYREEMD